jgi:transcription initiation factor TFIIIB Brf1 subunit/transcription initiation factor TFIIB
MDTCTDCGSTQLVLCWSDGDIVCKDCGLVAQSHIIDDSIPFKDINDYDLPERETNNTVIKKYTETFEAFEAFGDIHVENSAKKITKKDIASTVYDQTVCNNRGYTAKQVCDTLGIKTSAFWKATVQSGSIKKPKLYDILKRTIHQCNYIPHERAWDVIKVASKFLEVLEANEMCQSSKPDKLAISLMIIAAEHIKIKDMKRSDVCKSYQMSMATVSKNERMLQDILLSKR